jgi:hypothetical protein
VPYSRNLILLLPLWSPVLSGRFRESARKAGRRGLRHLVHARLGDSLGLLDTVLTHGSRAYIVILSQRFGNGDDFVWH